MLEVGDVGQVVGVSVWKVGKSTLASELKFCSLRCRNNGHMAYGLYLEVDLPPIVLSSSQVPWMGGRGRFKVVVVVIGVEVRRPMTSFVIGTSR